jgi:hypothetical protein
LIAGGWIRPSLSEQRVAALTAGYEALRDHAIEPAYDGARHGIALLLRQGVAAWLQVACETAATATPDTAPAVPSPRSCALPAGVSADVVHVLAAMALQHVEEAPV